MEINTIDSQQLAGMFLAGAKYLEAKKDHINELNVFPVPDGDTGTNMTMTIMSAAKAVHDLDNPDMKSVCKAISSGSLRGARGNSGVILSQLFRGFTKVIKTQDQLSVSILSEACQKSCETAYRAVMKPKEGTILTVAKGIADKAAELSGSTDDVVSFLGQIVEHAQAVLDKTPEMLPVLKQAGVVDSGGAGLLEILTGAYDYLCGKSIDLSFGEDTAEDKEEVEAPVLLYKVAFSLVTADAFAAGIDGEIRSYLEGIGGNVKVTNSTHVITVALDTNEPGKALNRALKYGAVTDVSIVNQAPPKFEQAAGEMAAMEKPAVEEVSNAPAKDMGFVAVSIGDGLNDIFRGLGADYIIEGGQTMNPSTEDILDAIAKVNAKAVFVLPNNKNIVLAAKQAVDLVEDKQVIVLPTKTLPQGITALINFIPDQSVEENRERMEEEITKVKTGEITYAVRDTTIDDKEIHQGDYMGITDKGISAVGQDIVKTFLEMLHTMVDEESSLLSIYTGSDATAEVTESLQKAVAEEFDTLEVELQTGGQPVYYYVVSVE
ncbi:MAG: DAK2 domain-containing protein [Candidatus Weimeria sp.]|nr:DAK2 domain-containing protein [Lachnospiraceae bacterium]MEE3355932.1 DAK2 domain-containing protein [Candidatus Weimeria sp.]